MYHPSKTLPSYQRYTPQPCFLPFTKSPSYTSLFLYRIFPLEPVISLFENGPVYYHSSPNTQVPMPFFTPAVNSPSQEAFLSPFFHSYLPLPFGRSPYHWPSQRQPTASKAKVPSPSACSLTRSPSQYHPWLDTNLPYPEGTPLMKVPMQRLPSGYISRPRPCGIPSLHSDPLSYTNPLLLMAYAYDSGWPQISARMMGLGLKVPS